MRQIWTPSFFGLWSISLAAQVVEVEELGMQSPECDSFVESMTLQSQLDPVALAKHDAAIGKYEFLTIGYGYVPQNPEHPKCRSAVFETKMIWAGGDFISCKGQMEAAQNLVKFAEIYNRNLKSEIEEKTGGSICAQ